MTGLVPPGGPRIGGGRHQESQADYRGAPGGVWQGHGAAGSLPGAVGRDDAGQPGRLR